MTASTSVSGASTTYIYDALDRMTGAASQSYTYDALDRLATRGPTILTYGDLGLDPSTYGDNKYLRDPEGDVIALTNGTVNGVANRNRRGDLTSVATPDGQLVTASTFDPYGTVLGQTGTDFALGYQSDLTDPDTGHVWMGARWYEPGTGTFTARDSYAGDMSEPITLNRYTYANGNPIAFFDPDGHRAECVSDGCSGGVNITRTTAAINTKRVSEHPAMRPRAIHAYERHERNQNRQGALSRINRNHEAQRKNSAREDRWQWKRDLLKPGGKGLANYGAGLVNSVNPSNHKIPTFKAPGLRASSWIGEGTGYAMQALTTGGAGAAKGALTTASKARTMPRAASTAAGTAAEGGGTQLVQRAMSRAEPEATQATGLVRGGREGTHYVSDNVNSNALRARQRLALPQTPEVRVTLEVPSGAFSPPKHVDPRYNMPGGGMERMGTGTIACRVVAVLDYC